MKTEMPDQLYHLLSCLSGEKWLKTTHGYRHASDSILFDSKWAAVLQFVDPPFIDEDFYGDGINSFKDELKLLGVVVDFSEGAHFVAEGLELPEEPSSLTADSVLSLLQCVTSLCHGKKPADGYMLQYLVEKLSRGKWLKTQMGYRSPQEALIFNLEWKGSLKEQDGPFVDRSFYKNLGRLEMDSLKAVGVKTTSDEACNLIVQVLTSHAQTYQVMRIVRFLKKFNWRPQSHGDFTCRLWIPNQSGLGLGEWVPNHDCVLHDRNNLFGHCLHVLDKYYENNLLPYLSTAFSVVEFAGLAAYIQLWNSWARENLRVSTTELNSFWVYISDHWDLKTERTLKSDVAMLPVSEMSGTTFRFVEKEQVFIPDDLQLKKLFTEASKKPLFVWFPQDGSLSFNTMCDIYQSLGVQKISESVEFSVDCSFEKMESGDGLICKPLVKLVLGFLSNPAINMKVEERHETARRLLDLSISVTNEPVMVCYHLQSEMSFQFKKLKKVIWDKNSQRLLIHKPSWKNGQKDMELVASFARAISEAVLPNGGNLTDELRKTIEMGFAFGFKDGDVDLLLLMENLELSAVDYRFLDSAYSTSPISSESKFLSLESLCGPDTPNPKRSSAQCKKKLRLN